MLFSCMIDVQCQLSSCCWFTTHMDSWRRPVSVLNGQWGNSFRVLPTLYRTGSNVLCLLTVVSNLSPCSESLTPFPTRPLSDLPPTTSIDCPPTWLHCHSLSSHLGHSLGWSSMPDYSVLSSTVPTPLVWPARLSHLNALSTW